MCQIGCCAAIFIRITIKDNWTILAASYYATPVLVISMLALGAAIGWAIGGRWLRTTIMLVVACVCLVWWHQVSWFDQAESLRPSDVKILFWNVARGQKGWIEVVETIRRYDPHVVGLVEARRASAELDREWLQNFPELEMTDVGGGMLLMTRGTIQQISYGRLGMTGGYKCIEIELNRRPLNVILVDISKNLFVSRRTPIEDLANVVESLGAEPVIVMGDFNTPGDSVYFNALREHMVNAFEHRGDGYAATWPIWPVPMPALHIDHIWLNRNVTISRCDALWPPGSDHRPLLVHVRDW